MHVSYINNKDLYYVWFRIDHDVEKILSSLHRGIDL